MPNIPALLHGTELFQPLLPIWFIAVEVQFYALWPWIIKKFDGPLSVLTCLMFMGGAIVCRWMIFQWKGGGVEGLAWNHLLTLSWMDCLSLGALLAILVHGGVINQRNGKMIAVFSSLGALVGVVLLTGTNWTLWGVRGFVEAFAMVNIILLTQSFSRWGKIESSFVGQVLSWTGKLSYGIYLVHVFVLAVLTEGMTRPLPTSSYILAVALILAISSGLAYLLWYLIERPCYAWGSVA
jgi:peptidoglycan/LPS O-acetylase OafA/YrhL